MKKVISHSLEETRLTAVAWLNTLTEKWSEQGDSKKHATSGATVVGLSGHLGAGKTAFTKAVAKELGVVEEITSPTFVIMKMYDLPTGLDSKPWKRLVHIDAYRLERPEEMGVLNFAKLTADPTNLILLEWPEHVAKALENLSDYQAIEFSIINEKEEKDARSIIFS